MSKKEVRNYATLQNLRDKIKQDIEDMEFLIKTTQVLATMPYLNPQAFSFCKEYLLTRINANMKNLITNMQNGVKQ